MINSSPDAPTLRASAQNAGRAQDFHSGEQFVPNGPKTQNDRNPHFRFIKTYE
jgi:hypothetical protein